MSIFFTNCKESDHNSNQATHDPSKPIVIDRISPESGRVATQLLIYGSNFGSDCSKISVTVKNRKAAVINASDDGTIIYCIVPTLRGNETVKEGDEDSGSIVVKIGEKEVTSANEFHYTYSQNVSTFLGFTDQDGNSAIVDGEFEKVQFETPFWMAFDRGEAEGTPRNFFLIEEDRGLRFINTKEKTVETLFRTGNNLWRPRTIAFTLDFDTMIIANDAGNWSDIGTIILLRQADGSFPINTWRTVMNHKQCNGGAVHPITGEYWFNSYEKSQVYKVKDRSTVPWRYGNATGTNANGTEGLNYFFLVQDNGWEFNIQIAPSGRFAYIVSKNRHYIARMDFNFETGNFEKPQPYVGTKDKRGFVDGVGLNALFWEPHQGAFDEEDNFYVADGLNHCIRKVTPTGQVSTFAGRPENRGYSDGALRDAQFNGPFGIIYDKFNQTFYIADRGNHRIRTIVVE
jgi:hypothetical protein